jgi:phosphate uptake regulator
MYAMAAQAMDDANCALLDADLSAADAVLAGNDENSAAAVAVDVALVGGCYQRFSDHAVRIARRVAARAASHRETTQTVSS